jgi:hypothetical protein
LSKTGRKLGEHPMKKMHGNFMNSILVWVVIFLVTVPVIHAQSNLNCTLIGRWTKGPCYAMAFNGDLAYIGTGGCFQVFNMSDLTDPQSIGSVNVSAAIRSIVLQGTYAFVATEISGIHVIDASDPANPIDLGIKIDDFVHELSIHDGILVATSGQAVMRFFDVSDPENPIDQGEYDTPGYARGIVIRDSLAYVADGDSDLHIINFIDPTNPVEKGRLVTGQQAVAIDISGDYAYLANRFSNTISIIDISDPENLVEVKLIEDAGQPADIKIQGGYAYVAIHIQSKRWIVLY